MKTRTGLCSRLFWRRRHPGTNEGGDREDDECKAVFGVVVCAARFVSGEERRQAVGGFREIDNGDDDAGDGGGDTDRGQRPKLDFGEQGINLRTHNDPRPARGRNRPSYPRGRS